MEALYICSLIDWKIKFGDNFFLVNLSEYQRAPMDIMIKLYSWLGLNIDIDFSDLEASFATKKNVGKYGQKEA